MQWSVFGRKASSIRTRPYYNNVNSWLMIFGTTAAQLQGQILAVSRVQRAVVKASA